MGILKSAFGVKINTDSGSVGLLAIAPLYSSLQSYEIMATGHGSSRRYTKAENARAK